MHCNQNRGTYTVPINPILCLPLTHILAVLRHDAHRLLVVGEDSVRLSARPAVLVEDLHLHRRRVLEEVVDVLHGGVVGEAAHVHHTRALHVGGVADKRRLLRLAVHHARRRRHHRRLEGVAAGTDHAGKVRRLRLSIVIIGLIRVAPETTVGTIPHSRLHPKAAATPSAKSASAPTATESASASSSHAREALGARRHRRRRRLRSWVAVRLEVKAIPAGPSVGSGAAPAAALVRPQRPAPAPPPTAELERIAATASNPAVLHPQSPVRMLHRAGEQLQVSTRVLGGRRSAAVQCDPSCREVW